jgi:AraC-like DNA-binding protein
LVGRVGEAEPLIVVAEIRWLISDLPTTVNPCEQCLLRVLFGQLVSRLITFHKIEDQAKVTHALLAFTATGLSSRQWQIEFDNLLDECDFVLGAAAVSRLVHGQVQRALSAIQNRYADPILGLQAVACEVGLSPSHVTRLLKLHTGEGFLTHLHRRRCSVAHRLLLESDQSIKEIAAAVGYRSVTQLGRHLKRYAGSTPASVRKPTSSRFAG